MLYRAKIGAFWHSRRHACTTNIDNLSVLARVSSPRVDSSPIWTRVSSGSSHLVEMVPGELHSHLGQFCGLAGGTGERRIAAHIVFSSVTDVMVVSSMTNEDNVWL